MICTLQKAKPIAQSIMLLVAAAFIFALLHKLIVAHGHRNMDEKHVTWLG